jgi:hypothetical protein
MSQSGPTPKELEDLERALNSETKTVNIRLREGEYQFSLAKAIASSELELVFPDAKALIRKLYGEKRAEDPQFVAKIQTILKKMEKMDIVQILPKEKPWELQRYALTSFKFQDVEKNEVILATKAEIEKANTLMRSQPDPERVDKVKLRNVNARLILLASMILLSFAVILWTLAQSTIDLAFFISAFCIAAACSTILGVSIARKR